MTTERQPLRGWKMLAGAAILGPYYLALTFRESRGTYPAARCFSWLALLAMGVCAYLMFTFAASPTLLRMVYVALYLAIFGLAFFYCWGLDAKAKDGATRPRQRYNLSRAMAWMTVISIVFMGINNIVQGIYFWLLGEWVVVYFSANANLFAVWIPIGLFCGFLYGIRDENDYINRDYAAMVRFMALTFVFIGLYNGIILALVVYPLQRLVPIAYYPQLAEYLFYLMLLFAICLSTVHLLRAAANGGPLKAAGVLLAGIPLIALHVVVVSAYSTTLNLTIASVLEDRQRIQAAKTLYAKAIPYIRYDHLLASLHHRQGVLHVMNQDYPAAIESFKKVLTDYSENYEVFSKARKYMDAYQSTQTPTAGRTILQVRHRTFEQAASCFPNSLSVILNFYDTQPVSTRKLSYAIKESFSSGTFVWKAETFLEQNGYALITTYWQRKETLIALLDAGYPILVYVPGHVYTLYGYDGRMQMFLTYDTAKANRWDDKPFWQLQRDWMRGSFMMSVVVPKDKLEGFSASYPQLERYRRSYQLWQKAHISDYYENKGNYWKDYDRHRLSASLGLDRLKMNESYFQHEDITPYPWDADDWQNEVVPLLSQPWALEWPIVRNYVIYLIYNGQSEQVRLATSHFFTHMGEAERRYSIDLLNLVLASEIRGQNTPGVLSISDRLIGVTDSIDIGAYWGHYFKARYLIDSGNLKEAADLLLAALKHLDLDERRTGTCFGFIVDALDDIHRLDPGVIAPDKRPLIAVARIHLAAGRW